MTQTTTPVLFAGLLAGSAIIAPALADEGTPAAAQAGAIDLQPSPAQAPWTIRFFSENDGGYIDPLSGEDKHYTAGTALTFAHRPAWAQRLAENLPFRPGGADVRSAAGYVLAQLIFTPEDTQEPALIPDDRPYAGHLSAGVYWQRASHNTLDHVQVDLGVVGPASLAEEAQDIIHQAIDSDDIRGWDNQLPDEPTFQAYLRRKWRLPLRPVRFEGYQIDVEFIPQVGLAAGTVHRHVEAAAMIRFGYQLPDDFGPGRIHDLPSFTGDAPRGWSLYGYGQVAGRAVQHNLFLSGNEFRDSHGVEEEPFVGQATLGATIGYRGDRWTGQAHYAHTFLSEEFEGQTGGDHYATLGVSLARSF